MIILPAIDIKDGACVRLYKGDFATVHKVAENAVDTARGFEAQGAAWLHMVDLDGAKTGTVSNANTVLEVLAATKLKIELGGGIRGLEQVEYYLSRGIQRVIIGSSALKQPQMVRQAVQEYGSRIAVGIDAKNGLVAAQGWVEESDVSYLTLAKEMEKIGVEYIIFTDIATDGMLSGPNTQQLTQLQKTVGCNIIASGGIRDLGHISSLKAAGVYGTICGKSIYQGTLNLKEAIQAAGTQNAG